ncbi:MAG: sugar ABC transporter permease [Clostridia bacterium]|nr:sugar ABC transporter permease [Clostridia bacterium]
MNSVNTMENNLNMNNSVKKEKVLKEKTKRLIFYILMAALPILQTCVFYIYVNISNIMLAFSEYKYIPGVGHVGHFAWFDNFKSVLSIVFSPEKSSMFGVSFLMYLFVSCFATPVSIIFSFYVYKKYPMSEFFRVILFFPQIISAVIMSSLYSYVVGEIYMFISGSEWGLFSPINSPISIILTVIIYNLWMGFGANILLASGAMSGINESVVESSHLDGCNTVQEFIYITLPSIFPTIITFTVIDLAAVFSNQMNLYTFFDKDVPGGLESVGYYLYKQTVHSPGMVAEKGLSFLSYPQISAMGVLITLVVLPVTLTVRRLLEKFGPSVD